MNRGALLADQKLESRVSPYLMRITFFRTRPATRVCFVWIQNSDGANSYADPGIRNKG
jgi:hypothetical protein